MRHHYVQRVLQHGQQSYNKTVWQTCCRGPRVWGCSWALVLLYLLIWITVLILFSCWQCFLFFVSFKWNHWVLVPVFHSIVVLISPVCSLPSLMYVPSRLNFPCLFCLLCVSCFTLTVGFFLCVVYGFNSCLFPAHFLASGQKQTFCCYFTCLSAAAVSSVSALKSYK